MFAHQPQALLGVEPLLQHDRRTGLERGEQHHVEPEDVRERQDTERDVVGGETGSTRCSASWIQARLWWLSTATFAAPETPLVAM